MRFLMFFIFAISANASACWDAAAQKYGVPSSLLYAIAKTESNLDQSVIGKNKNGTYDIGIMQINSMWLPTLKKFGISEKTLRENICVNIEVGAWILRKNIDKYGYDWNAIGAYNSSTPAKRDLYAWHVYKHLPGAQAGNVHPTEMLSDDQPEDNVAESD
jgi:soluble lytic murein transglycosylase-like protein